MNKVCTKCKRELPLSEFYFDTTHGHYMGACKKCTLKRNRKYYRIHREQRRACARKYYQAHRKQRCIYARKYCRTSKGKTVKARSNVKYNKTKKGRAMQARAFAKYCKTPNGKATIARNNAKRRAVISIESALTAKEWRDIIEAQKNRCCYCYKELAVSEITRDHIIPLSKGGHHIKENIVAACQSCNSSKGNRIL